MRWSTKRGARAIGHSRGGATTKIHALVDAWGRPVQFALTEGQAQEMRAAGSLLAEVADVFVVGDRAYDATSLREELKKQGCQVVIPSNPTRKVQRRYDRTMYKLRHRVENFFQRLKRSDGSRPDMRSWRRATTRWCASLPS
jgi:transposase